MTASLMQTVIAQGLPLLATDSVTPRQWQVLHHIEQCRTAAMGSYHWHCDNCQRDTRWYCSCRDRHCPICQGQASKEWLALE